jgi:hypothetical protein
MHAGSSQCKTQLPGGGRTSGTWPNFGALRYALVGKNRRFSSVFECNPRVKIFEPL